MWTETTRRQYRREDLRYASDMTDAEWALIEPYLPAAKRLGRPRGVALRAVVEALLSICCAQPRPGVCCRTIFRTARRCSATSTLGRLRGCGKPSISCCCNKPANGSDARPVQACPVEERGPG